MQSASYVWNDPDRPVSLHLSLGVVRELGMEALEAFKSVPRRGLEIGGLLLGHHGLRDGRHVIFIENFAPVESEHRTGPSYVLSDLDRHAFGDALSAHSGAVGMFRTHTRDEALIPQQDDVETFSRYFSGSEAVFLLIHPGQSKAAFFLPATDGLVPVHEFPFHVSDLPAAPVADPSPVVLDPLLAPGPLEPVPQVRVASERRPTNKWLVGSLAVLCGLVAGALLVRRPHSDLPPSLATTSAPSRSITPSETQTPDHVNLNVQQDGTAWRLAWDRNAPAIRGANLAILEITDGNHLSKLTLGPRELNSGMVSYWPETKDVAFRLQVMGNGRQTDDSIRAVGGALEPLPAVRPESSQKSDPPPRLLASKPAPPPPAQPPVTVQAAPNPSKGEAARSSTPEPRPSPFVAEAKPVAETKPAVATPPPPAPVTPRELEPTVTAEAEPVSGSKVGRVVSRIPLLRRLKKNEPFVPPVPLHEVRPRLTASERAAVTDPTLVTVRVYVTKEGKVEFAELQSGPRHRTELTNAAIFAARHWDFTPAHLGNEKVEGEVILRFRFAPPEPPKVAGRD